MSKPIGIWPIYSDFGLELVSIEYEIRVAVVKYSNEEKKHRRKINYDKDKAYRPYITFDHKKWYLDECIEL